MQGAPQDSGPCQGLAKEGSGSQAQMRLHGTHRTRQGTGAWPRAEQSMSWPRELMPYCREMARLWGKEGGHRKGRATYRTSNEVHSPGSWENRTTKEENRRSYQSRNLSTAGIFHAKLNISKQGIAGLGPLPSRVLWKAYSSQGHLYCLSSFPISPPSHNSLCFLLSRVYPLCGLTTA